jgi:hypothetical protein
MMADSTASTCESFKIPIKMADVFSHLRGGSDTRTVVQILIVMPTCALNRWTGVRVSSNFVS